MKVFISWSGGESHAVATALRDKLPVIINAVKPFVSSEDISKGSPWFQNIATELEGSSFGIVCLTKKNLHNKWILFETGALAGKLTKKRVAPLLLNLKPSEVEPPMGQLQLTALEKEDFFKLLLTLNSELPKEVCLNENVLKDSFEIWWKPFIEKVHEKLGALPKSLPTRPERSDKEVLHEVLSLTRSIANKLSETTSEVRYTNPPPPRRALWRTNVSKPKQALSPQVIEAIAKAFDDIGENNKPNNDDQSTSA